MAHYSFPQSDLKRDDDVSVYKSSIERGGLKSVRVGNDKWVTDAIDDRLTGGLTFTRVSSDPFAIAGIDIASYYERRGGGTWTFRIQDLFAALDRERGPGQVSANTPRG
jgi:hypothetical protein